eukprot:CAMPEP_0181066692 /NCGR_PEP_ID=MMETSP1070-20121207/25472_1 /TAXON_ID=265543 /ORGANISM="Minutocellus polymorphus, Strain NH13" /LENGTH=206 /DNA_ID=CAMNT_0023147295 /DNA_START=27 /DNA_END=647 /DNA_ORIENTATION=-
MCRPTNSSPTSASSSILIVDFSFDQNAAAPAASPRSRIRRRPSSSSKAVRFQSTTQVSEIDGLWQMSDAELEAAYCTADDAAASRADMRRAVRALRRNNVTTYRGLEHFRSNDELTKLQTEKERAVYAVLSAQEAGATSAEMAHLSSLVTKKAVARALRHGAMDAKVVTDGMKMDDSMKVLNRPSRMADDSSSRSVNNKKTVAFRC